ncbi:MAG: AEC family transporter [Proteobacteria bacterium]|nr:MAG: AEC family transporter [Pseudomonadota bacterium]
MSSFVLIFTCFALGILFQRFKIFPERSFVVLNRFVIYISLPALTIVLIHRLDLNGHWVVPVSMAWIQYGIAAILIANLGRLRGWNRNTIGALVLTSGLGNTSFVGFPLLEALYGPEAIGTGVLVDQPGTFFVASTLGVATAAYFSGTSSQPSVLLKKVFSFPPLLALIAAFCLRPFPLPLSAENMLDRLGATLIPLALVSVGMQIRLDRERLRQKWQKLSLGLFFKLALMPAFFLVLYFILLGDRSAVSRITIIESAMAPMITAGVLAEEYGLDAELSSLMIGMGIPLSLITVPLWDFLIGRILG